MGPPKVFMETFGSYENSSVKYDSQSAQFDNQDEYDMTVADLANMKRNFTIVNKNLNHDNEQYVER